MTILTLENFIFGHLEIPQAINFGGEQIEYTHMLPGGARVVDAMGVNYDDITWTGLFDGITGIFRAEYLENLMNAGKAVTCTYGFRNYKVLIKKFTCNFQFNPLPYSITLRVISDNTNPIKILVPLGFDDALLTDIYHALDLAELAANGDLIEKTQAVLSTMLSVASIAGQSPAFIANLSGQVTTALSVAGTAAAAINGKIFG